jgi:hypothetical protein
MAAFWPQEFSIGADIIGMNHLPRQRTNYGALTLLSRTAVCANEPSNSFYTEEYTYPQGHVNQGETVPGSWNLGFNAVSMEVYLTPYQGDFLYTLGYSTKQMIWIRLPESEWSQGDAVPLEKIYEVLATYQPSGGIRKTEHDSIQSLISESERYARRNLLPSKGWVALQPMALSTEDVTMPLAALQDMTRSAINNIKLQPPRAINNA